jgi:DNA-binding NtrC family response regulator
VPRSPKKSSDKIEALQSRIAAIDKEVEGRWCALLKLANFSIAAGERALIRDAIAVAQSRKEAAKMLGISLRALSYKLTRLNLTRRYTGNRHAR